MQMQARYAFLLAAIVFAIYLPTAWYLHSRYVPIKRPPGAVAMLVAIEQPTDSGFAYYCTIPLQQFKGEPLLYEDDKPLGPANSPVQDIMNAGNGRYAPWKTIGFVFSSSDNSDPRTNGRRYWAVMPN